jgi:aminoglycoside phosphotransferase (APT) family kinase protein
LPVVRDALVAWLEALLGSTVNGIAKLTQPWGSRTRTLLVSLDRGDPVIVQWTDDRASMARRLRIARQLSALAPWLPLPEVLAGDSRAPVPFIVTRYVPGRAGSALLADDDQAALLGARMGGLAKDISLAPIFGLGLSTTWADADRLDVAARRWLAGSADLLGPTVTSTLHQLLERLRMVFAGAEPVFAHGDFVPVNVIVRDGAVVALLDLERARIAHPLFDVAWFRCVVRHHHRRQWGVVGPAFMSAAGIALAPDVALGLDLLAALQCLEMVDCTPRSLGSVRSAWVARLSDVIASMPATED